jgi:Leucine-rich repeat (LRR) protein
VLSANTNAISTFPSFARGPSAAGHPLQRLSLYHNQLSSLPPGALRPLVNLTSLDLGRYGVCHGLQCWGSVHLTCF